MVFQAALANKRQESTGKELIVFNVCFCCHSLLLLVFYKT
jgi:hypothetical protein